MAVEMRELARENYEFINTGKAAETEDYCTLVPENEKRFLRFKIDGRTWNVRAIHFPDAGENSNTAIYKLERGKDTKYALIISRKDFIPLAPGFDFDKVEESVMLIGGLEDNISRVIATQDAFNEQENGK